MKHLQKLYLLLTLILCCSKTCTQDGSPKKKIYVEASAIYFKNPAAIREHVLPNYLALLPDDILKNQQTFFNSLDIHPNKIITHDKIQQQTRSELSKKNNFYYCNDLMPAFLRGYLTSALNPDDYIQIAKTSLSGYYYWTDYATGIFSTAIDHFFCHEKAEGIVSWNKSILPLLTVLNNLGYTTTLMANTNKNCMNYLAGKHAGDLAHFNQKAIISGENGFLSTDPELWIQHSSEQKKQTVIVTGEKEHVEEYINCGIPKEQCIVVDPEDKEQDKIIAEKLEKLGIDLNYTKDK